MHVCADTDNRGIVLQVQQLRDARESMLTAKDDMNYWKVGNPFSEKED